MVEQRMNKGSCGVPRGWVHNQAWWLVNGKKVAIFIDYQFEDLEVTFPMLRSVHKSSASLPLQLTG